jgi:anti-sigma factor RsiW
VELVTEYLEGTLPATDRARFDAHLGDCPYCRTYLEQIRRTIRLIGSLSEDTIDPRARDVLLARFRAWRRHPGSDSSS